MAQQSFDVNNAADVAVTFMLASQDRKTAVYMAPGSSLTEPLRMDISVDLKPAGNRGSDRVTVAASHTKLNAVTGLPATARVSVQVVLPRDAAISQDVRDNLRAYVVNYFTTANFALICDGIVP